MANVRMIPASISQGSAHTVLKSVRRRVAAYARVSTDSEEQLTSYEAQVDYYSKYIRNRQDWEFAGIYTDVDTRYGLKPKTNSGHLGCYSPHAMQNWSSG